MSESLTLPCPPPVALAAGDDVDAAGDTIPCPPPWEEDDERY